MPLLREPLPYDEGCAPISSTIFSCERIGPCIQDRTLSMRRRFSSRLVVQEFAARCGGLLTIAFSVFHAHFKSVRAERPAVAEDDGMSCSPVLKLVCVPSLVVSLLMVPLFWLVSSNRTVHCIEKTERMFVRDVVFTDFRSLHSELPTSPSTY